MLTEVTTILRGVRPFNEHDAAQRRIAGVLKRAMGDRSHLDTCETFARRALKPEDYAHALHDIPLSQEVVKLVQELLNDGTCVYLSANSLRPPRGIILIEGERRFPNDATAYRHFCVMCSDVDSFVARQGWTIENRRAGHLALRRPAADVFILVSATPSDQRAWLEYSVGHAKGFTAGQTGSLT